MKQKRICPTDMMTIVFEIQIIQILLLKKKKNRAIILLSKLYHTNCT